MVYSLIGVGGAAVLTSIFFVSYLIYRHSAKPELAEFDVSEKERESVMGNESDWTSGVTFSTEPPEMTPLIKKQNGEPESGDEPGISASTQEEADLGDDITATLINKSDLQNQV